MNRSIDAHTPLLAQRLLTTFVADAELLDDLLVTMDDQFQQRCEVTGVARARRWYWRESTIATVFLFCDSLGRESLPRVAGRMIVAILAHLGAIAAAIVGNGFLSRALPASSDDTIACAVFTIGAVLIAIASALLAGRTIRDNAAAARCAAIAGSMTLLAIGALHISTTTDPAPLWFRVLLLASVVMGVPVAASWRSVASPQVTI